MREKVRKFGLIFCSALLLGGCSAAPISQALRDFSRLLDGAPVQGQVSLSPLRQLDPILLRPASLYPQLNEMPLAALSALYQYSQHCSGSLEGIPPAFQQFEQAQCQQTDLPEQWFVAHPIYPLGGSTVWHYLQRHPAEAGRLQAYLHVRERPQALGGVGQLSDDNLDALANGQI